MMPVPSWLSVSPETFLSAAEAGARTGVSAASLRQQAQEASGKLGLGYAELGQRGAESAAQLAAAQSEAQAKMAESSNQDMADRMLKQAQMQRQQNESDRDYSLRMQSLGISKDRLALDTTGQGLEQSRLNLATQKASQPRTMAVSGGVVTANPDGTLEFTKNPNATQKTASPLDQLISDSLGNPGASGSTVKKPTRSVAKDYVTKYGDKAAEQLKADGYDISAYAD